MRSWHRTALTLTLLAIWAAGLVWAFWWFEGRYVKVFERPAYFNAKTVAPPFAPGHVQVVHVWQSSCPCNGGHQAYVGEMTERLRNAGVQFARSGQTAAGNLPAVLADLPFWPIPEEWADWPGAPSIAIWDAQGVLAYVGPYSDGAHCSRESSFVEPVVRTLLAGRPVNITVQDTISCLCDIQP